MQDIREGIETLKQSLKDKTTLFCGHSGVGKSSLLNCIHQDLQLKTGEISSFSGKGQHTTTFAEMFEIDDTTRIIDTPGIKEFGLTNIEPYELAHYFPELKALIHDCKYNNCLHLNEPECAVKSAINAGAIAVERYQSYCNILEQLKI